MVAGGIFQSQTFCMNTTDGGDNTMLPDDRCCHEDSITVEGGRNRATEARRLRL